MSGEVQPIIVKKIKKGGHGHHGGAWKVAYADFVTAMMAFFLLLWLLNVTTDEQKAGIADFFAPASLSKSTSGAGGILGGQTLVKEGSRISSDGVPSVVVNIGDVDTDEDTEYDFEGRKKYDASGDGEGESKTDVEVDLTEEQLEEALAKQEQQQFDEAVEQIEQAIEEAPEELQELAEHLLLDQTEEGLRIQLVDKSGKSMFAKGSADLGAQAKELMKLVSGVIDKLPNRIKISGHTDATPYRNKTGYGNWELSADRANASRRGLLDLGVPADRIASVTGVAAQEPLVPEDPYAESNRRISIVLLRRARQVPVTTNSGPRTPTAPTESPEDALKSLGIKFQTEVDDLEKG